MEREEIFQYVKEQYGTEPEYLWKKDPDSAVLRHKNGKWYAIIMAVEKKTLGLEEDGKINILDVKCDPDLVGMIIQTYGFLPGYHMNKIFYYYWQKVRVEYLEKKCFMIWFGMNHILVIIMWLCDISVTLEKR